jgi:hypothetical protein
MFAYIHQDWHLYQSKKPKTKKMEIGNQLNIGVILLVEIRAMKYKVIE